MAKAIHEQEAKRIANAARWCWVKDYMAKAEQPTETKFLAVAARMLCGGKRR